MDEIAIVKKQVQKAEWAERIVPVKPSCVHKNQSPPPKNISGGLFFMVGEGLTGTANWQLCQNIFAI